MNPSILYRFSKYRTVFISILCAVLIFRSSTIATFSHNLALINLVTAWNKQTQSSSFLPMELTLLTYADTTIHTTQLAQSERLANFTISQNPQDSNAILYLGLVGFLYGDPDNAIILLKRSAELSESRKALIQLLIGIIDENEGRHESASLQLSQIPINYSLARLAKYNVDHKYFKRASEQYQMALMIAKIANTPAEYQASWYSELSKSWKSQGLLDKSEQSIRQALLLTPNNIDLHIELAQLLIEQKRPQLAIQELESISAGFTTEYWVTLGTAFVGTNQFEQAKTAFLRAIESPDPSKRAWAFTALANFSAGRGATNDALHYQQQAIEVEPGNPWWRLTLANLHLRYGDTNSAFQSLDPVLNSKDIVVQASAVGIIGDIYRYQKQYPTALDYYTSALRLMPTTEISRIIAIRLSISRTHIDMDNKPAAVYELEKILQYEPGNKEALQLLNLAHK